MKLDTSKITDGVAVHCPKKEYVRPLFEAWGFTYMEGISDIYQTDNIMQAQRVWNKKRENTCFVKINSSWRIGAKNYYEENGYTIIPFEDLIIHEEESNLIKALHAVGVGDWLKDCVEFEFRGHKYKVFDDNVYLCDSVTGWLRNVKVLYTDMLNHPEQIKPLPKWTPEEQKMAEKDGFRFGWVSKDADAQRNVTLWETEPLCQDDIWRGNLGWVVIKKSDYPSLQPGECVSLSEIAGGE